MVFKGLRIIGSKIDRLGLPRGVACNECCHLDRPPFGRLTVRSFGHHPEAQ